MTVLCMKEQKNKYDMLVAMIMIVFQASKMAMFY